MFSNQKNMEMKFFKLLTFSALLAMVALTSCQKDEVIETKIDTPEIVPGQTTKNGLITRSVTSAEGLELGCVSIDFPFEMLLLDSTSVTISSEDDFINALEDEANYPVDFVYPLNFTDADGNSLTANNAEELAALFTDCIPDTGWDDGFDDWFFPAWDITLENSCYQLVYPVNLLDMDSASVTANDEAELVALLSDGNIYSFAFPLDLEDEDGNPVSAEDPEELFDLLAECGPGPGSPGCGIGTFVCYEVSYPATFLLIDGSTVTVNDDDEFAEVLITGEWAGFDFPLTLIDGEGNEITVNNDDELNEAILDCDSPWGGGNGGGPIIDVFFGCYDLAYPATLTLIDGTTVVVNNEEELSNAILNGEWASFGYPLTLIDEEGNEVVVNNEEELGEAIEECEGWGNGGPPDPIFEEGEFFCYDFSFPLTVLETSTGEEITFADSAEWEAYLDNSPWGPEPFDFVYPFTLIDEDGNEVTVNDEEEMFGAIEDCW